MFPVTGPAHPSKLEIWSQLFNGEESRNSRSEYTPRVHRMIRADSGEPAGPSERPTLAATAAGVRCQPSNRATELIHRVAARTRHESLARRYRIICSLSRPPALSHRHGLVCVLYHASIWTTASKRRVKKDSYGRHSIRWRRPGACWLQRKESLAEASRAWGRRCPPAGYWLCAWHR